MVEKAVLECNLSFEGIDRGILTKFVSVLLKGQEPDAKLKPYLQVTRQRTSINSFLKKHSESQFLGPPEKGPGDLTPNTLRRLLALACARSVICIMKHNYFTIAGDIYGLRDGSPIGLDLIVETASVYMSICDSKFQQKLNKLGIQVKI